VTFHWLLDQRTSIGKGQLSIAFVHLEVLSSCFLKFKIAYMSHEKCGPHSDVKYQAEISSVSREDTLFNRNSPQQRAGHFENFL
jgi:hypothetical protein